MVLGNADQLYGDSGDNILEGGRGGDYLSGGLGIDTASYAGSSGAVTVNLATGSALGGDAQGDRLASIENLIGSDHNDTLTGHAGRNVLEGGAGDDRLDGGWGDDHLDGGAGIDTVSYAGSSMAVTVDLDTGSGLGGDARGDRLTSIENLIGSDHDDTLTGDAGDNSLHGFAGDDQLDGGAGNDQLEGGAGDDRLDGGAGTDLVTYYRSSEAVNVNLATGRGYGGDAQGDRLTSIENLIGSNHDDTLTGDAGNNALYGFAGDDHLVGGMGDDHLEGGAGDDRLDGGAGSDRVTYYRSSEAVDVNLDTGNGLGGDAQGDRLTSIENLVGSDYGDTLYGNADDNILEGGAGDDRLAGGAGDDTLIGGLGADTYVFRLGTGGVISETDRYDTGQDVIDNTGRSGDGDRILITEGISQQDIWLSQNGDDLQIDVIGADDSVTVRDWFVGATNRVDYVQLGEGDGSSFLQSGNVQALVDAMSSFDPPASGEPTDLTTEEQTGIDTVVAAQWHNELAAA